MKTVKRAIDLGVALFLLIILSPLMILIALGVSIETSGGALFRQRRAGLIGREADVIIFPPMRAGEPGSGHATGIKDPRITRLGGFLRLSSLDELPQLFNVLKGEMSLVGPRPLLGSSIHPDEVRRLQFRPGITSLAAVSGRQALSWDRRMELDLWYVNHWTLLLGFSILARPIPVALSQKNVYEP